MGQALLARGAHHVSMTRLLPIGARQNGARGWPSVPERVHDRPYAGVLESARESVGAVFEGSGPDPERVTALIDTVREQIVDRGSALREILSVKEYENHTYCHSVNVAALSLLLGRRIGLDDAQLDMLAEGALLHDVGKRGVPVEIIRKAGPLNQREWRIMQRHPALGAELLATTGGFSALTPTIALEHHREYGGGGYPDLGDLEPHLISQIVAVADTYEALTGARAYRPPLVPDEACLILARMAGAKLNPALVRSFVGLITFFPLGSLVRTSRGEVGAVIGTFEEEPLHPTIVLVGEDGSALSPRRTIDMAARGPDGAYLRYVVETLPSPAGRLPDDVWAIEEAGPAMVPGEAEPQRPPVGGRGSGQRPARPERRPVA